MVNRSWVTPGSAGGLPESDNSGNATQNILSPLVSIGLSILFHHKDLMGPSARNKSHNIMLVLLTLLAIWGAYQTFTGFFK